MKPEVKSIIPPQFDTKGFQNTSSDNFEMKIEGSTSPKQDKY